MTTVPAGRHHDRRSPAIGDREPFSFFAICAAAPLRARLVIKAPSPDLHDV
jgi:hypothetical protein